ncbi:genetic suppressor element 1-like [Ursus maritimus]|uniref:Genetic suppressor element 1-like n=1 Tax=Ursus maritimus TaxID=29073 RepID=A0A8M1G2J9_URSMA|nr:genetic suppressor element 1-like [Ursus maritimus]
MFGLKPPLYYLPGMSHEPKSPSLGMLSTATRTTATVNPLTPSPLNGALVPSGSPATSSALSAQAAPSSSFAAALRKLAKQAEEPRGKRRAPQAAARGGRAQPPCSRPGLLGEAGARPRNSGFPRAGAGAAAALTGLWRLRARTCSGHSCLSLAASFWGGSAVPTEFSGQQVGAYPCLTPYGDLLFSLGRRPACWPPGLVPVRLL